MNNFETLSINKQVHSISRESPDFQGKSACKHTHMHTQITHKIVAWRDDIGHFLYSNMGSIKNMEICITQMS